MSNGTLSAKNRKKALLTATAVAAMATWAQAADTGWNQTAAGPWDYSDPANWVNGTITGNWDATLTLTAGQTVTLGADAVLSTGLSFNYAGSHNVTFRGQGADRTLTLGGDVSVNTVANRTITLGSTTAGQALNIDLGGATRTLTALTNRTLSVVNVMSNGAIVAAGGVFNFSAANTYSGGTTVNAGNFSLNGSTGSAANSDFVINTNRGGNSFVTFNSNSNGVTGATRVKSLTLNGQPGGNPSGNQAALLTVLGNAVASSNDVITNGLTVTGGYAIVSVTPNAASNARLTAGSFTREAGSSLLFRGPDLGVSSIASQTAGDANISFVAAPAMLGGTGSNTTDHGIIVGAYGDSVGGNGTGLAGGANNGLVTYNAANGVRLIAESEYKTSVSSGQTQLDNVKLTNTGGAGIATSTLTQSSTINSLSFNISGTGSNGGITLAGDPDTTLVLNSGMIYASQTISGTTSSSNGMVLSVPNIDLNGHEGVVIAATSGLTSQRGGGVLEISGSIGNDGGNGMTFAGSGVTRLSGTNTYTGITYVNSGVLFLSGGTDSTIIGDIIINGGAVEVASNRIADTSNITLHSGSFKLQIGNEGTARSETFNNLVMTGGSYGTGASGHPGASRIQGYANLSGGSMSISQEQRVTVTGVATLSGTTVSIGSSESPTTAITNFTANGGLVLVNPSAGAYTPFSITAHATNLGGRLLLNSDLTFTGNATNANAATITTTVNTNLGTIGVAGVRTFAIGDGAATVDLVLAAPIVDGPPVGAINKTGAGTLEFQYANSYTGGTELSQGRLIVGAASNLGTGNVSVTGGVLELDGNFSIADDATLYINTGGVVNLDFSNLVTENVGQLVLNGTVYSTGVFDSDTPGGFFTGSGTLTVVPEPGSMAVIAIGAGMLLRRRRARS